MAGFGWRGVTPPVACAAGVKTSVLQLKAGANIGVELKELIITISGGAPGDPAALVEVERQTTAASTGGAALTLTKDIRGDPRTIQATARRGPDTTIGTLDALRDSAEIDVVSGQYIWQAPYDGEEIIIGGDYLAVCVTSTVGCSVVARAKAKE